MIILEGSDGSGKSFLIEYIKSHSKIPVVKPFYPKKNQLNYYLHSPAHYANFYLERYYISELVYPQFKPNRVQMEPWHQYLIEAGMMPFFPMILYVRPSKETIIENIKVRGDDYVKLDEIDQMIHFYDETIENSYLPSFNYDYKSNSLKELLEVVESLHEMKQERALRLQKFLSSGNYDDVNPIMFIGEMPSDYSIGRGFVRAFISNTGSSEFFHKCLWDAGYYPNEMMPYFTNWNKCECNDVLNMKALEEEIELVQPRKIVCLGEKIRNKVGFGETIFHPSYIKRFGFRGGYESYIQTLKNLL